MHGGLTSQDWLRGPDLSGSRTSPKPEIPIEGFQDRYSDCRCFNFVSFVPGAHCSLVAVTACAALLLPDWTVSKHGWCDPRA